MTKKVVENWSMWSTKGIRVYCYNNGQTYDSINKAAIALGIRHHGCRRVVIGANRQCCGYVLAPLDENGNPNPQGKVIDYLPEFLSKLNNNG